MVVFVGGGDGGGEVVVVVVIYCTERKRQLQPLITSLLKLGLSGPLAANSPRVQALQALLLSTHSITYPFMVMQLPCNFPLVKRVLCYNNSAI